MKKLNLIAAVVALAFGGAASAGTLTSAVSGGTKFAVENFTGSYAATDGIQPGVVTYTIGTTNGIVINAGGTIYFTVRLAGGVFKAAPLAAQFGGTALDVGGAANGVVGTPVLSTDKTTVMVPVTYTLAATLGVGSTLTYTPPANNAATAISGVKSTLSTAGGSVTATASLSAVAPAVQAPSTTTAPNTGTAQAADIDGPAGSGVIATSLFAVDLAVSNLPTYTGRIDLTASPAASNYALVASPGTAVVAKLGSVTPTNSTTVARALDGTTAVNVAATVGTTPLTITVTPGTNEKFPVGSVLSVSTAGDQCVTQVGALAAFTATTAAQAATLTVPNASTVSGTAVEICLTKPSTNNVATPITPSITAVLDFVNVAATAGKSNKTGVGYALGYNGAVVDTVGYWPAALSQYGYTTFTRVINTGSVATTIQGAFITQTTGAVGSSVVLPLPANYGTTLAPGASVTWANSQLEGVLGAPGVGDRPTLRISGQTNKLKVQQFVQAADGTFSELSGSQGN